MAVSRKDQSIFTKRINVRQMEDIVRLGAAIGKTVFFFGGAGLGKSQKMQQTADALYPKNSDGRNLCDVRLSDKEPQDIAGIPIPMTVIDPVTNKEVVRTMYAVPEFWPTDPNWKGIIFLDELPNAGLSTQHSSYQVLLDHIAGTFAFPAGCVYVGAGNRDTDGAGTTEMPGPLVNRMIITEVEYDLDVWIEDFAVPYRLHPHVIGFLKQFPDYFYTGDVEDRKNMVFASPRQWETVSRILDQYDRKVISDYITEVAIAGAVGEGLDALVMAYHVRASKLPSLEDIFSGAILKHPRPLSPDEVDLVYVLSQTCMRKIEDEVMSSRYSDDELIKRIGNFLTFMYDNHGRTSKDMVMALMTSLFRAPGGKDPILNANPKRGRLMPLLRKNVPTVMTIVLDYQKRYGTIMEDFQ